MSKGKLFARGSWLIACAGSLAVFLIGADKSKPAKPSKEAVREYNAGLALLNASEIDRGVEKLRGILTTYPGDPVARKATELLRDFGVGPEARVVLKDRKVFHKSLKILDKDVLATVEGVLKSLEPHYRGIVPVYKDRSLSVFFYDSQKRYREEGGLVTAGGHFSVVKRDMKRGSIEGKIEWYLPPHTKTPKDRETAMKGSLCHELTHYWNATTFGGLLPPVFEEGIATYFQSRLNTEYYQHYRATDREQIQAETRNALNTIVKLEDFLKLLDADRGFGQGGDMISRWYGLCYSICDFFEEGQLEGRKATFAQFFSKLEAMAAAEAAKERSGGRAAVLNPRKTLESLVAGFYDASLADFHKALVQHILTRFRQM